MGGKVGLIIAVFAGIFAVIFNNWYLTNKENELERGMIKARVVVAARDITKKNIINENMLAFMEIPQKYIQPKAVLDPKTAVGMVNLVPFPQGVQILQSNLVPFSPETGLGVKMPVGTRGVLGTADGNLLSLINPGDHLDMLLTLPDTTRSGNCVLTRLQNITVLGIGQDFGSGGQKQRGNFLTFALTPEESQLFILAQGQGKITYVVRPYNDNAIIDIERTSYPALYERQKAPVSKSIEEGSVSKEE